MDIKQNFLNALRGDKVERVPLMMREGIGPWYDPEGVDNFTHSWMLDSDYQRMKDAAREVGVVYYRAHEASFTNRFMMTNNSAISVVTEQTTPDLKSHYGKIDVGNGEFLTFKNETKRGIATDWNVEVPVAEWEDVEKIMSIPFEVDLGGLKYFKEKIDYLESTADDRTVNCIFIPSPVVAISRGMHFDFFLENSIVEEERIKEMLDIITAREILLLKEMLPLIPKDMILWVGGSEQCTPPMMSPYSYDELVTPYESQLVKCVKETTNHIIGCHSHGRVKHALPLMVQAGFDATDPVEPPPQGDILMDEAFEITNNKISLIGNMQWSDLENMSQDYIRERVRDLAHLKDKRLIIGGSAGPINKVTKQLSDNHIAWFEEYAKLF